MTTVALGLLLILLCGLGIVVALLAWLLTTRQGHRWESMRQEVRDALTIETFDPLEHGVVLYDDTHEAIRHSIVVCDRHSVVTLDSCPLCEIRA